MVFCGCLSALNPSLAFTLQKQTVNSKANSNEILTTSKRWKRSHPLNWVDENVCFLSIFLCTSCAFSYFEMLEAKICHQSYSAKLTFKTLSQNCLQTSGISFQIQDNMTVFVTACVTFTLWCTRHLLCSKKKKELHSGFPGCSKFQCHISKQYDFVLLFTNIASFTIFLCNIYTVFSINECSPILKMYISISEYRQCILVQYILNKTVLIKLYPADFGHLCL